MSNSNWFPAVQTRQEKYQVYRYSMARYAKAMKEGFFFEAILIDYAMIEDRLRSFLWHAGAFERWEDKTKFCKKAASRELKTLIEENWPGRPKCISLEKISHKIGCVRAVTVWASESIRSPDESVFLRALRSQCEGLDAAALLTVLTELESWIKARNEIIHSLLNKRSEDLECQIEELAREGNDIGRAIDRQVAILKKGERVRLAARMQTNRR